MAQVCKVRVHTAGSKRQKGFSLIELLIVVAIIVIIMTMALPGFRSFQMKGNETSAMASLKAIREAQIQYQSTYPTKGFADNLAALGTGGLSNGTTCAPSSEHACILDSTLSSGAKAGRMFCITSEDSQLRMDANLGASTTPPSPTVCISGQFSPM